MIKRVVGFALHQPFFVVLMTILFIAGGWAAFHNLPIEAFPDVSDIQVNVITTVSRPRARRGGEAGHDADRDGAERPAAHGAHVFLTRSSDCRSSC